VYAGRVKRLDRLVVVFVGLVALGGCRDRNESKPAPATGAGSAVPAPPQPPPPPLPASYAGLVGDKPASLGPSLAGLRFGEAVDPEKLPKATGTSFGLLGETAPRRLSRSTDPGPQVLVDLEMRADKLFAFHIELLTEKGSIPDDHCDGVQRALEAKWGPAPERVWVDRTAHVRAALRDTCILIFERYVDVTAWIGNEPTAIVPVGVVGKPASELASRVGPGVKLDEDVTFRDAGVGEHAAGPTVLDAYLKKGSITGLGVEAAAGAADRAAIRDRISAVTGVKPARDAVTGYDVWAAKVPVRMLEVPTGVRVEVGNLTP
jgi:hypothetical protein